MAWDEALLEAAARLGRPVLRFYGWSDAAATFGYSQRYAEVAEWTALRPLIRRPTGGGLVPHEADWTYSLVFPPGHPWHGLKATESYRRVHEWISAAFTRLHRATHLSPCRRNEMPGQCFSGAEQFDVLADGRKIAGAAQRRNRLGLLIQGSVQPGGGAPERADWECAMCDEASSAYGVGWIAFEPDAALMQRVDQLAAEKYLQPAFHRKR